MYCKLKGKKGKNNPKLEEAVKKWPKGFSLWESFWWPLKLYSASVQKNAKITKRDVGLV